jgi:hypothetical protein
VGLASPTRREAPSQFNRGPMAHGIVQRFACPCGGTCPRCAGPAASPNSVMRESADPFEREADHAAEQIMRATPVTGTAASAAPARPQFKRVDGHGSAAHAMLPAVGAALSSVGRPLEPAVRDTMEQGFGRDLGAVRIHDGPVAATAARSIDARAFTVGHDIVFDEGQYRPTFGAGKRLLAHELTHVMQQSGAARPALQAQGHSHRYQEEETPGQGFSCTLTEMADPAFDNSRSCCDEGVTRRLRSMLTASHAALELAISRIESGASIDDLLTLHFGPSGPSMRSSILANIRTTLGVAKTFLTGHNFLCRPFSDDSGCHGEELALSSEDSDITVCLGGGSITFDWDTILHELFHVSGMADLPVYGGRATPAQVAAGEIETYYRPGVQSEDPRVARYPSSQPRRNADSYRALVAKVVSSDWSDSQPAARFAPTLAVGGGTGLQNFSPTIIARVAFTPLGRGLHFVTPGAVGFWSPTLGVLPSTDPDAAQARGYAGGELGLRYVTGAGPVAGVFDLAGGAGAAFTRGGSIDPAALVRGSAGVRFGGPTAGVSVNADLMRMFDFALAQQRTDGWILGVSVGLHWGGHSGAPR